MKNVINKLAITVFFIASTLALPVFSEPANLSILKEEIKQYHDSGLYEQELAQVIKRAQLYIAHQAAVNQRKSSPQKLAVVLDIDETSLSNYEYMIKRDFTGTKEQFHNDVLEASAPAIKPTLALYEEAMRYGIKVFFVTGRSQEEKDATQENLIRAGYTQWAGLYLRPDNYQDKSIVAFKSQTRKLISEKGYVILATIGDQCSDLKGGYAEKGFKLPNPYYYLP